MLIIFDLLLPFPACDLFLLLVLDLPHLGGDRLVVGEGSGVDGGDFVADAVDLVALGL